MIINHKSKSKKVKVKFNIDHNTVFARFIQFSNKYIINGALQVKNVFLTDTLLSQAKEFELDYTHYKRGCARRTKVDGKYYGKPYISNYLDDIDELFQRDQKFR